MPDDSVIAEVAGLYKITPLKIFRKTDKVTFDFVPVHMFERIDAMDRVIHEGDASSPGAVGPVERPWYMHPYQEDNLIVLYGTRHMEIYTKAHGKVEYFTATPHEIIHNGEVVFRGGAVLSWPCNVFHRVKSGDKGSAAINVAVHHEGFDIRFNFSVYDLNTDTGDFRLIRAGHLDQPSG